MTSGGILEKKCTQDNTSNFAAVDLVLTMAMTTDVQCRRIMGGIKACFCNMPIRPYAMIAVDRHNLLTVKRGFPPVAVKIIDRVWEERNNNKQVLAMRKKNKNLVKLVKILDAGSGPCVRT